MNLSPQGAYLPERNLHLQNRRIAWSIAAGTPGRDDSDAGEKCSERNAYHWEYVRRAGVAATACEAIGEI